MLPSACGFVYQNPMEWLGYGLPHRSKVSSVCGFVILLMFLTSAKGGWLTLLPKGSKRLQISAAKFSRSEAILAPTYNFQSPLDVTFISCRLSSHPQFLASSQVFLPAIGGEAWIVYIQTGRAYSQCPSPITTRHLS